MGKEEDNKGGEGENNNEVDVAALQTKLDELSAQNADYQKLLLSDDFVNFVANKAAEKAGNTKGGDKGGKDEEPDFENMTKKDLVQFILTAIDGKVHKAVQPVAQDAAVVRAQQQVKEASAKYPDYWDFKDAMVEIATKTPNLTAEDCYHLAKGRNGGKPPAKSAPRSEVPTNTGSKKKEEPTKGLPANFDKAWKSVFGNASQAS